MPANAEVLADAIRRSLAKEHYSGCICKAIYRNQCSERRLREALDEYEGTGKEAKENDGQRTY